MWEISPIGIRHAPKYQQCKERNFWMKRNGTERDLPIEKIALHPSKPWKSPCTHMEYGWVTLHELNSKNKFGISFQQILYYCQTKHTNRKYLQSGTLTWCCRLPLLWEEVASLGCRAGGCVPLRGGSQVEHDAAAFPLFLQLTITYSFSKINAKYVDRSSLLHQQ
jgi:hypothetical protein